MQGDIVAAHAALTKHPDPLKPTRKRTSTTLANPPPSAEIATSTKREPDAQQTLQSNLKKVHALKLLVCLAIGTAQGALMKLRNVVDIICQALDLIAQILNAVKELLLRMRR